MHISSLYSISRCRWSALCALCLLLCAAATPPGCDSLVGPAGPLDCSGDCGYRIVNTYPHDRGAFTQGLTWDGGVLYESTGINGASSLRRVELATGTVLQKIDLARDYFGEGSVIFGDRIFMLTWRSHVGFIFDKSTFANLGQFSYSHEGWGITTDGQHLIVSDGTSLLRFYDPTTLSVLSSIAVKDGGTSIQHLNELEYVNGEILANIWLTDNIARINPQTGEVTGWIQLPGLLTEQERAEGADVLNGIAYDAAEDRLFVTGKRWPKLFQIELVPRTAAAQEGEGNG